VVGSRPRRLATTARPPHPSLQEPAMRRPSPLEMVMLLVDLGIAVQLLGSVNTAYLQGYLQGRVDADLAAMRRELGLAIASPPAAKSRRRGRRS
jgi:hypothetical protein